MIPLNLLAGLHRLSRLLRCRSHCRLIEWPPIIMVAKRRLRIFKHHLVKTSHLASLTQDNLGAHKDNPLRDNLRPQVVLPSLIIINLLITQVNLLFHRTSLASSKLTLLDTLVSHMFIQTKLMSSMVNYLGIWVNLVFSRANPPSSIVTHLGMFASLKSNQVNQLSNPLGHSAKQGNPNPNKFTLLGRWANFSIHQANFSAR